MHTGQWSKLMKDENLGFEALLGFGFGGATPPEHVLSNLIEQQTGVHIGPATLRLFLLHNWPAVEKTCHAIVGKPLELPGATAMIEAVLKVLEDGPPGAVQERDEKNAGATLGSKW